MSMTNQEAKHIRQDRTQAQRAVPGTPRDNAAAAPAQRPATGNPQVKRQQSTPKPSVDGIPNAARPSHEAPQGKKVREGDETKRLSVNVPRDVHDAVAFRKIFSGKTMGDIVTELLQKELRNELNMVRDIKRQETQKRAQPLRLEPQTA